MKHIKITQQTLLKLVLFCLSVLLIYAIVAIIFQWLTGQELSPTLTDKLYTVLGTEIVVAGFIKVFKLIKGD